MRTDRPTQRQRSGRTPALIEAIEPRVLLSAAPKVGSTSAVQTAARTTAAPLVIPGAPTNLVAIVASSSQINLTWATSDALASSFVIERSVGGGAFAVIATVTKKSYSNTGLAANTTYTYRVGSKNTSGTSAPSAAVSATTKTITPAVPTSLTATVVSSSQINLAWSTTDSLATSYNVDRSPNGSTWTRIASVTTKSYSSTGLTANTTYYYRVSATNSVGTSATTAKVSAKTLAATPAAPKSLTATAVSISQINLAWTAGDALATGYIVERSTAGGAFAQVANGTTTSFSNTGLTEGVSYVYRVTAYNAAGSSAVSLTATAATLKRPATPSGVTATATSVSQISVAWTGDALATGYVVERSTNGGAFAQAADVTTAGFSDSALSEGVSYAYRVSAYNAAGTSAVSATASTSTLKRPAVPTDLIATPVSISQIHLAWTTGDGLATGFVVERSSNDGTFAQVADVIGTSFNDTGLTEGATYAYRVSAYNSSGASAASGSQSAATLQRPASPIGLTATPVSTGRIDLAWESGDLLATGFIVERSSDGAAYLPIGDVATTRYSDTGLTEGATYTYRVTSYDAAGPSVDNVVTQAATMQRPAMATLLTATPASISQINLAWTGDARATGYLVEQSTDGQTFTQIADVTGTSLSDTALNEGATYTYRVTAYNTAGASPVSDTEVTTTLQRPAAPSNLSGTAVSNQQINLAWSAGDALATGFIVSRSTGGGAFTQIADVTTGSFIDTGLTTGTTYTYRVTAYNLGGLSPAQASLTIATLQPPALPMGLAATSISPNEIDLTWSPGDARAAGYRIERSTNYGAFVQIADVIDPSYADMTLSENTIYQYRVSAFSAGGVSAVSATARVTTKVAPLFPPPSDRPSALNTGVDPSVILTTVAAFKPKSNTTYTNLYITAQMTLTNLTNVKFINCVMDLNFAQLYNVRCDGASNIVIDHCELKGAATTAVYGDGFTVTSSYIHQSKGDAFKAGNNTVIWGNYVAELGYQNLAAHADGVQIDSKSHVRIIGNYFNMPIDTDGNESNTDLFVQGTARDVIYDHNWSLGGNFSVHAYADGGGGSTVYITNNTFYAGTVRYGFGSIGSEVVWENNLTDSGFLALPASRRRASAPVCPLQRVDGRTSLPAEAGRPVRTTCRLAFSANSAANSQSHPRLAVRKTRSLE